MTPRVIFIVGPTATGKTALAAALAKELGSAVISADSMQIYRGMHIASAAPDESETQGVPHKLIEILPYGATWTVADYAAAARKEIDLLLSAGKTPVVAGGTGLYINALADNIEFLPVKTDVSVRERLSAEYDRAGGEALLSRLKEIDREAAEKLDPADKRRIVRALEIYETSGLTKTKQNEISRQSPAGFEPLMIGITFSDRQKLYDRINGRVDIMLRKGLIEEARAAFAAGEAGGAAQAIGHKEFFGYFRGEKTLEEAAEELKRATRRYAKRQLTWFKRDSRIHWIQRDITPDLLGEAKRIIESEEKDGA